MVRRGVTGSSIDPELQPSPGTGDRPGTDPDGFRESRRPGVWNWIAFGCFVGIGPELSDALIVGSKHHKRCGGRRQRHIQLNTSFSDSALADLEMTGRWAQLTCFSSRLEKLRCWDAGLNFARSRLGQSQYGGSKTGDIASCRGKSGQIVAAWVRIRLFNASYTASPCLIMIVASSRGEPVQVGRGKNVAQPFFVYDCVRIGLFCHDCINFMSGHSVHALFLSTSLRLIFRRTASKTLVQNMNLPSSYIEEVCFTNLAVASFPCFSTCARRVDPDPICFSKLSIIKLSGKTADTSRRVLTIGGALLS